MQILQCSDNIILGRGKIRVFLLSKAAARKSSSDSIIVIRAGEIPVGHLPPWCKQTPTITQHTVVSPGSSPGGGFIF